MTIRKLLEKELGPLVGGHVVGVAIDDEDYFGLVIALPNGTIKAVYFLADFEGNGPGGFSIADLAEVLE